MKVLLVSAALMVALCAAAPAIAAPAAPAAAPAPPKGWTPSGRLFLVPARLVETPQEPEEAKPRVLDSGEYYVLLENGRLQMVKYTAVALDDKHADKSADKPAEKPADKTAKQVAGPFARFQVDYLQYPRPAQVRAEQKPDQERRSGRQQDQERGTEQESGFETNLQFRDVKPISAPVYAPNSAPLVRILKK